MCDHICFTVFRKQNSKVPGHNLSMERVWKASILWNPAETQDGSERFNLNLSASALVNLAIKL